MRNVCPAETCKPFNLSIRRAFGSASGPAGGARVAWNRTRRSHSEIDIAALFCGLSFRYSE